MFLSSLVGGRGLGVLAECAVYYVFVVVLVPFLALTFRIGVAVLLSCGGLQVRQFLGRRLRFLVRFLLYGCLCLCRGCLVSLLNRCGRIVDCRRVLHDRVVGGGWGGLCSVRGFRRLRWGHRGWCRVSLLWRICVHLIVFVGVVVPIGAAPLVAGRLRPGGVLGCRP